MTTRRELFYIIPLAIRSRAFAAPADCGTPTMKGDKYSAPVEVEKLKAAPYNIDCFGSLAVGTSAAAKIDAVTARLEAKGMQPVDFKLRRCSTSSDPQIAQVYTASAADVGRGEKLWKPGTVMSIDIRGSTKRPDMYFIHGLPCIGLKQ
jgi:hypothetical protein